MLLCFWMVIYHMNIIVNTRNKMCKGSDTLVTGGDWVRLSLCCCWCERSLTSRLQPNQPAAACWHRLQPMPNTHHVICIPPSQQETISSTHPLSLSSHSCLSVCLSTSTCLETGLLVPQLLSNNGPNGKNGIFCSRGWTNIHFIWWDSSQKTFSTLFGHGVKTPRLKWSKLHLKTP